MGVVYTLAFYAMGFAAFLAAVAVGIGIQNKTNRDWPGWPAGILTFVLLVAAFEPAFTALESERCKRAADYVACMDGE